MPIIASFFALPASFSQRQTRFLIPRTSARAITLRYTIYWHLFFIHLFPLSNPPPLLPGVPQYFTEGVGAITFRCMEYWHPFFNHLFPLSYPFSLFRPAPSWHSYITPSKTLRYAIHLNLNLPFHLYLSSSPPPPHHPIPSPRGSILPKREGKYPWMHT